MVTLLGCYLSSLISPLLPFIDYTLNFDYIVEVLCINKDKPELNCKGKCHLISELKNTQNDNKTRALK